MRESHESAPGGPEASPEAERRKNKNRGKKVLAVAAAVGILAAGITIGTVFNNPKQTEEVPTAPSTEATETVNPYVGELANGIHYDYSHYADREYLYGSDGEVLRDNNGNAMYITGKESWNAYDYDMSGDEYYGNREATTKGILEVASRTPEALASYAYNLFTDEEKTELGIDDMLITEIDDYMSDEKNSDGGDMRGRLLDKLEQVLNSEHTKFHFYEENAEEDTNYIYFVDDNNDGRMTPDELHLGYDTKKRDGARQVDIVRSFYVDSDKDGDYYVDITMLDLNMPCGFQPNYTKGNLPQGLPYVPSDADPVPVVQPAETQPVQPAETQPVQPAETQPVQPAETQPVQTGKQGDPHGGDMVTPSEQVNPSSEVTKEQNDNMNADNQGYIDDQGAKPGDASVPVDDNSPVGGFADSDIVAPEATTDEGRLQGGENQGTTEIAGENPYRNEETETQGSGFDQFGNGAQAEAQSGGITDEPVGGIDAGVNDVGGIKPGGDNYTDQEEEDRFAAGDF